MKRPLNKSKSQLPISLLLFFTQGVSLKTWEEVGMLDREIAIYQKMEQLDVSVQFFTYGDARDREIAKNIKKIDVHFNRFGWPQNIYSRLAPFTLKIPENGIVKSNQVLGADIALKYAKRKGAHFIARCGYLLSDFEMRRHGIGSEEYLAAFELEKTVFQAADAVVVTTPKMKRAIDELYGIAAHKVEVIPNYVRSDLFSPGKTKRSRKNRIGFVGRLDSQKNPQMFLQAIKDLDAEIEIIGDGPLRGQLEEIASEGAASISFLGNIAHSELPEYLQQWDVFVMPSLYEGHPKALLEAMSCGLAVVGSKVSGIKELISDEENGLLVELSVESIRDSIIRLMEDQDLRAKLGKSARETILEKFSLERIVEQEYSLYKKILGRNASD